MKKYFIGGLGSNIYHSKDFLQELDSQVYFLSPYEKNLRDETELKLWFKLLTVSCTLEIIGFIVYI